MKPHLLALFGLLFFATAPFTYSQGTYTQIDVPGATATFLIGIDSAGNMCGFYNDTMSIAHGFFLSGGAYTTIDYPGLQNTYLYHMNDKGQIVGIAFESDVQVGFVYNRATQEFAVVRFPGSPQTTPESINCAGAIVGFYQVGRGTFGFKLDNSTYTSLAAPKGISSWAEGITASGDIVGGFGTPNVMNFFLRNEKYKLLNLPNDPLNAEVYAINGAGTMMVGSYAPAVGSVAGFLYDTQAFQELQFPGSAGDTEAYGINNAGEVVGTFTDQGVGLHGFTWISPAAKKK
jgi:probable HAF family extracellular repeat protein